MEKTAQPNRGGRPQKSEKEKNNYPIKVRTNQATYERLEVLARHRNQSLSTLVREMCQGHEIFVLTPEQEQQLRQLAGMANNLNQLTKLAHQQGMLMLHHRMNETIHKLNSLLDTWSQK